MFIDEVKIKVIAWKWWDWCIAWRREKCIPKGWPRWWDGWNWGWVYLQTTQNLNTLSDFRHKKVLKAKSWEKWWLKDMHWAAWEYLVLNVPVWTIVKDSNTWELIYDLDKNNQKLLIVSGGRGWYWNSHFCSPTRQAPGFSELWDIWGERELHLELKLVADIWIIWVPSAWKSSLINTLTDVKAKVWDYPFTTLVPNLWVMDHKWKSLVLEDVPGLIPWAHTWKWLWIEFLKHIERTWVLLHLVDLYRLDQAFTDYSDIRKELEYFSPELAMKEEVIVLTKADLLDSEMIEYIKKEFIKKYPKKKIFVISSATSYGLEELKDFLVDNYSKNSELLVEDSDDLEEIKLFDLKDQKDSNDFRVKYLWDYVFEVKWQRIEQIVRMTDFTNIEWVMRVYDVLDKMWIMQRVEKELKKIFEVNPIDDSFYFEWNDVEEVTPKIIIWEKTMKLDKLKYNL